MNVTCVCFLVECSDLTELIVAQTVLSPQLWDCVIECLSQFVVECDSQGSRASKQEFYSSNVMFFPASWDKIPGGPINHHLWL